MPGENVLNLADYRDRELIDACRAIVAQAESGSIKGMITLLFDDSGGAELAVVGCCADGAHLALAETTQFLSLLQNQSRKSG